MRDLLRPPAKIAQSELMKAARHLERLKLRRRVATRKLAELDDQIRVAQRVLTDLAADIVTAGIVTPDCHAIEGETP